jgi:hypothetical protein
MAKKTKIETEIAPQGLDDFVNGLLERFPGVH